MSIPYCINMGKIMMFQVHIVLKLLCNASEILVSSALGNKGSSQVLEMGSSLVRKDLSSSSSALTSQCRPECSSDSQTTLYQGTSEILFNVIAANVMKTSPSAANIRRCHLLHGKAPKRSVPPLNEKWVRNAAQVIRIGEKKLSSEYVHVHETYAMNNWFLN